MLEHVKGLLAHSAWADAVFFKAWARSDRTDPELLERVAHSSGTQEMFLDVLTGADQLPWEAIHRGEARPPWLDRPKRGFEELRDWTSGNHARASSLAASLDEAAIARDVRIGWFQDPPCVIPAKDAIVQLALHSLHHRAQNLTRIKQLGGTPKNVDYIIWLWKGRPAPIWD